MAWNGRNESILGSKAAAEAGTATSPSRDAASNTAKPSETEGPKKSSPAPPPPPKKNVWNGQRHTKIMGSKETIGRNAPVAVALDGVSALPPRSPSPAASTVASSASGGSGGSITKMKDDIKALVQLQQHHQVKETDETTNSTAGSSTTNITIDECGDPNPPALEGNVVTTVTSNNSGKKDGTKSSSSGEKTGDKAGTPTARNTNIGNSYSRTHNHHAKNASAPVRRSGSGNKGGRGNNVMNNGNNNHAGKQQNNNYSRGTSTGSSRRRANGVGSVAPRRSSATPSPNTKDSTAASQPSSSYVRNKRVFDPHKAKAIQLAKEAQNNEDRSKFASTAKRISQEILKDESVVAAAEDEPPLECIATGYGSCAKGINDGCGNLGRSAEGVPSGQYSDGSHRYPGRVAMVDGNGNVLADIVVRPPNDGAGVVSYLTPLTGLTAEICLGPDAVSLEDAVTSIKGLLPKNGILVGQTIDHDVEWLGLVPERDFDRMVDISMIFRQRMPAVLGQAAEVLKKKEEAGVGGDGEQQPCEEDKSSDEYLGFATRYRHFSLRHVSLNLLGTDIQSGVHDPVTDAQYSLALFHKYRDSSVTQLRIVRDGLHRAPITPSFAAENTPVIDGVCVSAAGYHYKRLGRKIWRWYSSKRSDTEKAN
eukprot:CAMPEP_0181134062 /NCGR_PEP_ID=MMETSP1071-20121207/31876_1 /TAXON_ID=35127 /ORGANISM="Thalassiosira sp., Strain NH16" /LENGTH=648 /DNA_ID=CAMNT_0023220533 /DNA_START=500 /DNA_END=2447 /DNA_ORIENTATION=+